MSPIATAVLTITAVTVALVVGVLVAGAAGFLARADGATPYAALTRAGVAFAATLTLLALRGLPRRRRLRPAGRQLARAGTHLHRLPRTWPPRRPAEGQGAAPPRLRRNTGEVRATSPEPCPPAGGLSRTARSQHTAQSVPAGVVLAGRRAPPRARRRPHRARGRRAVAPAPHHSRQALERRRRRGGRRGGAHHSCSAAATKW
jgi:hypothetical protein